MSGKVLTEALTESVTDDTLSRHFLSVWPVVEAILEAFSKATRLPIFAYLNESKVFQSSIGTMPRFCAVMLSSSSTEARCTQDGLRRAKKVEPDVAEDTQLCHAGMINGRREINTGCVGTLSILFGSRKSTVPLALSRRRAIIDSVKGFDADLATRLQEADSADQACETIEASDAALMDAISGIIQRLLAATVGFRSLAMNMAHELSVMMLGLGLLVRETELLLESAKESKKATLLSDEIHAALTDILTESRLGLYIVRNFLSHTSEARYKEVVRPSFADVDLGKLVAEMVDLHRLHAATKDISFDLSDMLSIPKVYGSEMELRRLMHNVLNNAVKYSYRSVPQSQRVVRVSSKVPFDPGFRRRSFSISIENYGLGLSDEEKPNVLKPGYRGRQAIAEVPIGAGIGLSEAAKIMKVHGGEVKVRSRQLHQSSHDVGPTYLTTVDLVFPFLERTDWR